MGTVRPGPLPPAVRSPPDPLPRYGDRRRTRIGILGGSFNPAHEGHLHVARLALKRLRLDQVWLLVSPGNPLKSNDGMAPMLERLDSARILAASYAHNRRILATGIESRLHTRFTYDTLRALRQRFPLVRFVWLMGADNLVQLPRWQHWTGIAATMPFAVMPRPTYNQRALSGQAAQRLRPALRDPRQSALLPTLAAPAWTFLPAKQNHASATAIRLRGLTQPCLAWPRPPSPPDNPPGPAAELQRSPLLATTRA